MERIASLQEIETYWSLLDIIDAHESLDLKMEAERLAAETAMERR